MAMDRAHQRISSNSKNCERRVARAWGSQRWRNNGSAHCDVQDDCPIAIETTRNHGRRILPAKVAQAQFNANGKPWVLVVAGYSCAQPETCKRCAGRKRKGDRLEDMVAVCNHGWLLDVCRKAGVIPPTEAA